MLISWVDPMNAELIEWVNKIEILFKIIPNKTLKILSASQLILYYGQRGDIRKVRQLSVVLNKMSIDETTPGFLTAFLKVLVICCDFLTADFQITNEEIDSAYDGFRDAGLNFFNGFILPQALYHAELKGDVKRVKKLLEKYKDDVSVDSDMDLGHYHFHAGISARMDNDISNASHHMKLAVELTEQAHAPYPESLCRNYLACLYVDLDMLDLAIQEVDKSESVYQLYNSYSGLMLTLFTRSWIYLKQHSYDAAIQQLTEALEIAYEKGVRSFAIWPHTMVRDLCSLALENNIQPDVVKQIIKIYKYTPDHDQPASEHWPYPIKFYTLNRFGIVKDGQPLHLSDKNQQFIKALIAFGGRDVHEETLSNALWPDAEGDAAHQNFASTLHRVRKAVGSEVIQLRQNHLSLNSDFCWIDIWELKRTLSEIEKSMMSDKQALSKLTKQAISLYQGPFFGTDATEHWMLSAREKLSNQFLKSLNHIAETFCQINEYTQALHCYQKGLEIDDLSESIYQGLMYCHSCSGNRAEGLAVYEQCCERLNTAFGIAPSRETEKLYLALRNS